MKNELAIIFKAALSGALAIGVIVIFWSTLPAANLEVYNISTQETESTDETKKIALPEPKEETVDEPIKEKDEQDLIEVAQPEAEVTIKPELPAQKPKKEALEVVEEVSFYGTPPMLLDDVNTMVLPAVVNILCGSNQGSAIAGATGSGIVIDPRGVILTNAHVAQYLILQNHVNARISCVIRVGAPAKSRYVAEVLAFPNAWAEKHAQDVALEYPTGTGEHDWALLYITGRTDGSPKPSIFPFISYDTRRNVAKTNDTVLLSSYPAGFLGGATLQRDLWPVSTIVSIQKVFTFTESTLDLLSLGGNIVAQGGSSGGGVVNPWGKLVGIISTSSIGDTTEERDLRAVTLSHINESIREQTGFELLQLLQQDDFENRINTFQKNTLPYLLELYNF